MRVLAMGFPKEHLTAVPLTESTRHRLLGSCIDGNITNWLVDALCTTSPTPGAWLSLAPSPPSHWQIYLNSASSSHMWGDLSEFTTYSPHPNGPAFVGGIKAVSYGTGAVQMRLKTSTSSYITTTLYNVMYVLDLAKRPGGPVRLFSA